MRPPDSLRGRLRQTEIADLPLLDQIGHRADGLFDRDGAIDAMLVVEIDMLDPEPPERRIARGFDVLGAAVHADPFAVTIAHITEFRGEYYAIPFAFDRLADQLFVCVRPVDIRGIEERDAELDGPMDCRNRF